MIAAAPMTISLEKHVARAIYEAMGFGYSGRTVSRSGPYGNWAVALKAAHAAIAAMREREGTALDSPEGEAAFNGAHEELPDAEAMRAECESIAASYQFEPIAKKIRDRIAALKGKP